MTFGRLATVVSFAFLSAFLLSSLVAGGAEAPLITRSRSKAEVGTRGMVVSDDRQASAWGAEILRRGGNAIDAAVATGFMLSVTRPYYGSLGGGGFLVFCPAPRRTGGKLEPQKCHALDYREIAPKAATRDMFLRNGKADTDLSQNGALASGVPGVPAGLLTALENWGTKPRTELLREPIHVAESGFRMTGIEEAVIGERWENLNPAARKILGCRGPSSSELKPCPAGTFQRQADLARVLREISGRGQRGFYDGWVARKIVSELRKGGGILTLQDLASYHPLLREPLVAEFEGEQVITMPPPSAGGAVLLQMLGYVERAKSQKLFDNGYGSVLSLHALAHAMALGFADRAKYFGDPDFVKVPLAQLLAPSYLDSRWRTFDRARAAIPEGAGALQPEGSQTTHFSVVDAQGNAVAVTTTINDDFGSGFVPSGTGVFMNNEMDDFSVQPGVPNLFGLVGAEANAVAPGKKPLSSMTPTIVRDPDGFVRFVLGAAGGPKITTSVFNVLVNRLVFGLPFPDAVAASRMHEQWKPASLRLERYGFAPETRARLKDLGYELEDSTANAKIHALECFREGRVWGVPDPRGDGVAVAE